MTKFYVYHGYLADGDLMLIGEFNTRDEAWRAMVAHQKQNYPLLGYYFRCWKDENEVEHIDYGSHVNFYYISTKAEQ